MILWERHIQINVNSALVFIVRYRSLTSHQRRREWIARSLWCDSVPFSLLSSSFRGHISMWNSFEYYFLKSQTLLLEDLFIYLLENKIPNNWVKIVLWMAVVAAQIVMPTVNVFPFPLRPTNRRSLNLATPFFNLAILFFTSALQFLSLPADMITSVRSGTSLSVVITLNANGKLPLLRTCFGNFEQKIVGEPVCTNSPDTFCCYSNFCFSLSCMSYTKSEIEPNLYFHKLFVTLDQTTTYTHMNNEMHSHKHTHTNIWRKNKSKKTPNQSLILLFCLWTKEQNGICIYAISDAYIVNELVIKRVIKQSMRISTVTQSSVFSGMSRVCENKKWNNKDRQ